MSEKIPNIPFSSRATEFLGTGLRELNAFSKSNLITSAFLPDMFNRFEQALIKLKQAMTDEIPTSGLLGLNTTRCDFLRQINFSLKGFAQNPSSDIAESAQKLKHQIDVLGGLTTIVYGTYSNTSGKMGSLLSSYTSAEMQTAIAQLPGMEILINELYNSHNNFVKNYTNREIILSQHHESDRITSQKCIAIRINNDVIIGFLNSMQSYKPEVYGTFSGEINSIISSHLRTINGRQKNNNDSISSN